MKQNPAVHHKDVALEVPQCELVDLDLLGNSLYRFVHQDVTPDWSLVVTQSTWISLKIVYIDLSRKTKHKIYIICEGL